MNFHEFELFLQSERIKYELNVELSKRTWIRRGGVAGIFVLPNSSKQLEQVCRYLYNNNLDFELIGHTSNVYFLNTYCPQIVVTTKLCNHFKLNKDSIECEAGVSVIQLAKYCVSHGIAGFEYLTELPGTVGAALVNNSSCKDGSISGILDTAEVLLPDGRISIWKKEDFEFSFRNSCLKSGEKAGVILSLKLTFSYADSSFLESISRRNELDRRQRLDSPQYNLGCTYNRLFVNGGMPLKYKLPLVMLSMFLRIIPIRKSSRKHYEKCFLLRISGYKDLIPYISDKLFITYLWKDAMADTLFPRYKQFMKQVMRTDSIEIQEKGDRKKVNLLTIHWGNSYGGIMQTYSTYRLLENLGYDVTLINLIHSRSYSKNQWYKLWLIRNFKFSRFIKTYMPNRTIEMNNIDMSQIPKADCTIVGSDQVWNRDITTYLGLAYFLNFVSGRRISFASSFGKEKWVEDNNYSESVRTELSKFNALSVREKSGQEICKSVFSKEAALVLDPTLVLGYFPEPKNVGKRKSLGVFEFILEKTQDSREIVDYVSKTLKKNVYRMGPYRARVQGGPIDWIGCIKNASFVITSSFHGLAFAILFQKDFIVVCSDKKKFTRLSSLLDLLGLNDRFVNSAEDIKRRKEILFKRIDYQCVDAILAEERLKSIQFLKTNI